MKIFEVYINNGPHHTLGFYLHHRTAAYVLDMHRQEQRVIGGIQLRECEIDARTIDEFRIDKFLKKEKNERE